MMSKRSEHQEWTPTVALVAGKTPLRARLTGILGKKYRLLRFSSQEEALQGLPSQPIDILISDYALAGKEGVGFFVEAARISPGAKQIITGPENVSDRERQQLLSLAHQAQIDLFLFQPFHPVELVQAVERLWRVRMLEMERDMLIQQNRVLVGELEQLEKQMNEKVSEQVEEVTRVNSHLQETLENVRNRNRELSRMNEMLNTLATIDHLTGLPNRREFHAHLVQEWANYQRYGQTFSVIMVDIDHFKQINDQHGHECGDQILKKLGILFRASQRRQDITCRYGGEEFVLILPRTTQADAFIVAENLRQRVAEQGFSCKTARVPVHISLGVAGVEETGVPRGEVLVHLADQALYRAKEGGRNRTEPARREAV
ncbi:MAG: diguanylate cyclase [Deltaproteobacteria bacterium]|nr:diguanylate cyclase [Deltaproteobacteria bacterium]